MTTASRYSQVVTSANSVLNNIDTDPAWLRFKTEHFQGQLQAALQDLMDAVKSHRFAQMFLVMSVDAVKDHFSEAAFDKGIKEMPGVLNEKIEKVHKLTQSIFASFLACMNSESD